MTEMIFHTSHYLFYQIIHQWAEVSNYPWL